MGPPGALLQRRPAASFPWHDDRGLTLTELVIVGALAVIVVLALSAFYFGSQQMWISGSTQALTQRDATMLVGKLSQHIHEAGTADVVPTDANHDQLTLTYADGRPPVEFEWNDSDDRVHMSVGPDNKGNIVDHGPVVESPVTRFHLTRIDTTMVELTIAELQSANGDSVRIASRFTLLGR